MIRTPIAEFSVESELLFESAAFDAPKCLVYTNFLDLNEQFGQHHLQDVYVARAQSIPAIRVHRLPAGVRLTVCADEDFIVFLDDGRVLEDQVRPYWTQQQIDSVVAGARCDVGVEREVVLVARYGLRTWGHWLCELLPKVICVEAAYPGRFSYVVPESLITDTAYLRPMRQSLAAYGIGRERLFPIRAGETYRLEKLFAVSPIWFPHHALHPTVAALMRKLIASDHGQRGFFGKGIALLRRESTTRNLVNADEICEYLQLNKWSIVEIATLDFMDQVRIFAEAEGVVSVLGSGLAGLIYSPLGLNVLTLAPNNWGDLFFYSLMQERRARLADIRGFSLGSNSDEAALMPFRVRIADLEAGLNALGC